MTRRYLISQRFEQVLHFGPSLSLGDLVAIPQCWGSTVGGIGFGRICLTGQSADLLMLKRMMVGARHGIYQENVSIVRVMRWFARSHLRLADAVLQASSNHW